ncbi:MAG: hypothetical protein GVY14_06490 [Spirochaetes bacterium]|nr:hypothetical protein [Spirochaetota bacterium]
MAILGASALGLLLSGCAGNAGEGDAGRGAGRAPETVEGFWFFTYSGRGDAPSGEAFAYVTETGTRLGGGIASEPLGGPLSGRREGATLEVEVEDVDGAPAVTVEGRVEGVRAEGEWTVSRATSTGEADVGGTEGTTVSGSRARRGTFEADYFDPADVSPGENPFVGAWTDFEDGGVTTLIFDDEFRFTGSEADLEFAGQYAFDTERGLVGVYEADAGIIHMEKLSYRFEGPDTVVLNGSVYRRQ